MSAAPLDITELYQRHGRAVLRRIRRFYSDEQAMDVLQEVFARAVEKADTYRGDAPPLHWLYGLTTRHCLARLRDAKRRRELLDEVGEIPWSCPITTTDPEASVFLRQLWREIDPELAQIGVHYYVDGMSQADIGALMGVSGRTISNRIQSLQDLARTAASPVGGTP
ncbi:MAG: sigma-70 family RNA polymerase sigma factor [Myxococcales bacterium]|nr:sigma-70 family RNA polymerase sigma factor [Myxococcales bacterium]MCB9670112.1 sigma-70 family RNA polymerase sigma factor [Alphaproteobacteria bacterium]MCB9693552.1 sigma-70 family RNA polymerase sigma factor [Alphaproteobacteria bacterium]